jgi:T4 RnlA family RNA ligase
MKNIDFLLKIIKTEPKWFEILSSKPYNIKIRQHDIEKNLYMFSYNMIESDFNKPEVKASRGIIISIIRNLAEQYSVEVKVVCYCFDKFFNFGESQSDDIDWKNSYMRAKIDGSLIKLYYYNDKWNFATNNGFNADAEIQNSIIINDVETASCKSFQDLINLALTKTPINFDLLNKDFTYFFELTSPKNRIVVQYKETKLWLLGGRDLNSFQEYQPEDLLSHGLDKIDYPKKVPSENLDFVLKQLELLDVNHEGYVVVDNQFRRIKCKAATYLSLHKMKDNNGAFTYKSLFEVVMNGTQDDVKSYFEETIPYIEKIENSYRELTEKLGRDLDFLKFEWKTISSKPPFDKQKKKYAAIVLPKYQYCSSMAFELCKDKSVDQVIYDYFEKLDYDKFKELTGFKE